MALGLSALDFKLGLRMLRRYPALSLIGGLALSFAVVVGSLAFELVVTEVTNPSLPFEDGDRIVRLELWDRTTSAPEPHTLYDLETWRRDLRTVEELGAARSMERNLILPEQQPRPIPIAEVSPSAFSVTRVPPILGRPLVAEDAQRGAPDVVVIAEEVWEASFARDPDILGRTIQLGDTRATVVGVMPEGFGFPRFQRAWLPFRERAYEPGSGPPILVFGRLAPGATLASARAEFGATAARDRIQPRVVSFAALSSDGGIPLPMIVMFVGVFMVLMGISANVATLMFARTALRESEIVVRTALGATRGRVIAQLLAESLVLAGCAAIAGLVIASGILRVIWYQRTVVAGAPQPFWVDATLEPATVLWAAGLALIGAVLVGVLPGLKATKTQVRGAMAQAHAGASGLKFGGIWSFVIVAQLAVTVIAMTIAVGASSETLRDRRAVPAFPADEYLTFRMQFDSEERNEGQPEAERARLEAAYREMEGRLLAEPSVSSVTLATSLPGTDQPIRLVEGRRGNEEPFLVLGAYDDYVGSSRVDLDFFEVFELPILAGRGFSSADLGTGTVVVNETLARHLGGNPLGMQVRYGALRQDGGIEIGEPGPWLEVVGVVKNAGMNPTDRGDGDVLYHAALPSELNPGYLAARVRGEGSLGGRIPSIALEIDPALRVRDVLKLDEVARRGGNGALLGSLAVILVVSLAILLSAAGLYALMSVAVERRTREIGIRRALGADRGWVLRAVFARSAFQLGAGIVLGNLLVFGLRSLAAGTLEITEILLPMAAISTLLAVVGIAACAAPARRALRVEATEAIKGE